MTDRLENHMAKSGCATRPHLYQWAYFGPVLLSSRRPVEVPMRGDLLCAYDRGAELKFFEQPRPMSRRDFWGPATNEELGMKMQIIRKIRAGIQTAAAAMTIMLAFGTAAHANIRVRPEGINFGSQSVGSTSTSHNVTVTNENQRTIKIESASASISQFTISGLSLPATLAPGESLTASVKFTPSAAQAYSGSLKFTRANGEEFSVSLIGTGSGATTTAPIAPAISSQPASVKIAAGQTATFNVAATGTAPMTYLWKKNGSTISGANSSTYTTPSETAADNNSQFTAEVSNTVGNATSNPAVLTVTNTTVAPAIATQPASQTIISGKTATFSVSATGTAPLTYQWNLNGSPISGATSSSYTTPAETANAQFTVTVSNSAGSATSNPATLSVTAATVILNSSASSLSFGSVNVSSSATPQTVTLTNAGNSNVTISNVTVSGAGFNASGASGVIVTPGQTTTLTATFTPSATGAVTGKISVASNASNSPDSISLSGTGVAATVTHSVALSWTASTSAVIGYNTYSSTVSGGPYTKLTSTPDAGLSYTDSTVQAGQTYFYVVTSVDSSNVESDFSAQVSAVIP